jgi:hypothetical protein
MNKTFQQRDMSGVLFKNDKGGNEKRPDYRGELNINGSAYEVSGWIKDGQKGKFMSLSMKRKEQQQRQQPQSAPANQGSGFDDMSDDEIPF